MDIFAHGLWTNAVYEIAARTQHKERSKKDTWLAVLWGIAPDIFAFGPFIVYNILTKGALWPYPSSLQRFQIDWSNLDSHFIDWFHSPPTPPNPALIPSYVYHFYNFTHSFVIFALVFLIVWALRRSPYWLMAGWGLHIATDIWSHTARFFPTPVFFPVSNFHFSGISWASPPFLLVNYTALVIVYLWLYKFSRRRTMPQSKCLL